MESNDTAVEVQRQSAPVEPLRLVALNPSDLEGEQNRLIGWSAAKAAACSTRISEIETNLEIAVRSGFNTATLRKCLNDEVKRHSFYTKLGVALQEGFFIIPNMRADVFAVRTKAQAPSSKATSSTWNRHPSGAMPSKQLLPVGAGRYVDATRTLQVSDSYERETNGKKETVYSAWSTGFVDEIDFPFTLARAEVLTATQRALALKVFDEMAAVPATKREDPMVIGRIYQPNGRHVSFLVAWFLDTEVL